MTSIRIADPMLPRLAADFGSDLESAAWVITGFALAYGIMQLVSGPLGDRYGKLRLISTGAFAAAVGSLLCALAPSMPLLIAARFVTGACCAAIIPLSLAWIGDSVDYEDRQETLARFATGTLLGLIAGQAFGGIAADTIGWRGAFGALAVLFSVFAWRMLPSVRTEAVQRAAAPAARASLYRSYADIVRSHWAKMVLAITFVEAALLFGTTAFVPTWLHTRFGIALSAAGMLVAAMGIGGLAFLRGAKFWLPRLGEKRLTLAGGASIGAGLLAIAALDRSDAGLTAVACVAALGCMLVGFGFYMMHNTLQALATQLAPHARGTAVGLFAVALFLGQSAGIAATASLAGRIGYQAVFVIAALMVTVLGAGLSFALRQRAAREAVAAAAGAGTGADRRT